jgi:hypothetical protein
MELSNIFSSVAYKRLAAVDLPRNSNQHEINGIQALKDFFQTNEKFRGDITWFYFTDEQEPLQEESIITFYDARAKSVLRTGRSEWRLYYTGDFLNNAETQDSLFLLKTQQNKLYGLIFQSNSSWEHAAQVLFQVNQTPDSFHVIDEHTLAHNQISLLKKQILNELNIDLELPSNQSDQDIVLRSFGASWPSSKELGQLARSLVNIDGKDADSILSDWLNKEEDLFRALENVIVSEQLKVGFSDVNHFISYSLSVQNRRKSRMGLALENHLAELFQLYSLKFDQQVITEAKNKPDFIFPSKTAYHDPYFDEQYLVMLAAKSSCKERWRQILPEANRIPQKHLCTLDTKITDDQIQQMLEKQVQLVLPTSLYPSLHDISNKRLFSVIST